jgi:hypothetical protein
MKLAPVATGLPPKGVLNHWYVPVGGVAVNVEVPDEQNAAGEALAAGAGGNGVTVIVTAVRVLVQRDCVVCT